MLMKAVTVLVLAGFALVAGQSRRCYSCSYNYPQIPGVAIPPANYLCRDPFVKIANVPTVPCSRECYKLKGSYQNMTVIIRGCGSVVGNLPCVEAESDKGGVSAQVKCCGRDYCNGGVIARAAYVTSVFAMLVTIFLNM